jgi:hypothetical protein
MKTRCLIGICLIITITNSISCRKKSPPEQEQSIQQTTAAQKPTTAAQKPTTAAQKPTAKEIQPDETDYYALFLEGKKVGYAIENRIVDGQKVTTSVDLKITLNRAGIAVSIQTKADSFETTDGKPLGFELEQNLGMMLTQTIGTINEQGKLIVKTGDQQMEYDWPTGALMSEGVRLLHYKYGLKAGSSYSMKVFDPTAMQAIDVEVKVGSKENVNLLGRVVSLTEVASSASLAQLGSFTSTEYYDDDLKLQKSVTPLMGMTIEQVACTKEFAMSENDVLEVVEKMFLSSPVPLDNLGSTKSITYQLVRTDETAELQIPSNDNQKVQQLSDGKVLVTVEPVEAPTGVSFPYKGNDPAILESIEPTRFLQSDDPRIIKLARQAVGDAKDAAQAAKKIESFVAGYIKNLSLSVGYASSVEVAESKCGDCTEFAVLTAALCRAVGIPAQVVAGVAYVDDFAGMRGFGGHAWAQAYIGGKWIGLDAAFKGTGRGGYDAGHIALAAGNGEPGNFLNLGTTLGRFKIEKVTVNK